MLDKRGEAVGFSKRELKGLELAVKGHVKPLEKSKYIVKSERSQCDYVVCWERRKWTCTCQDYMQHGKKCKHIFAVIYYLVTRGVAVGAQSAEGEVTCPHCKMSDHVIKRGFAYEKSGRVQRYYCKKCKKRFNYRSGLEGSRGEALAIVLALDLYFRGVSLRQISQHLEAVYGVHVSHTTIHGWIKRYVELVSKATEKIKLETSARWHCDDTKLKVRGRHVILWSILDSETKILIAQHISTKREAEGANAALEEALQKASESPLEVVTDGCQAYEVVEKALPKAMHIQGPLNGPINNNKIERYFKTVKQRFRSIQNFGNVQGAETFAKGFAIFYNLIRKHQGLGDKAPLEFADVMNAKCWQDLIKKARNLKLDV